MFSSIVFVSEVVIYPQYNTLLFELLNLAKKHIPLQATLTNDVWDYEKEWRFLKGDQSGYPRVLKGEYMQVIYF